MMEFWDDKNTICEWDGMINNTEAYILMTSCVQSDLFNLWPNDSEEFKAISFIVGVFVVELWNFEKHVM